MREFESQIRLQKWQVDEAQRQLAEMMRLFDRLHKDLRILDQEQSAEAKIASISIEARRTYPAYLAGSQERRLKLTQSINEIEGQIAQARDALANSFGELKKFELASGAAADRMRVLRDRREQQRADEIGLGIHRRRATR